ncbi:hypothetical protein D6D05_07383 [Aureobasidium pullulans]|nr:hypothetical protein D6D05_07383 [Aureobasidium pullulans]
MKYRRAKNYDEKLRIREYRIRKEMKTCNNVVSVSNTSVGFEFVLKINPRKWWWYQHYGFHAQTYGFQTPQEANEHDFQQDSPEKDNDVQLSDTASVGNRPGMAEQHPSFANERAWDDFDIDHMDERQSSSATSTPRPIPSSSGGGYTPHFGWD